MLIKPRIRGKEPNLSPDQVLRAQIDTHAYTQVNNQIHYYTSRTHTQHVQMITDLTSTSTSTATIIPKNFRSTLPPRKRARTKEEKEQRRIERIIRNRRSAHQSREKKRLQMKFLEEKCELLERIVSKLDIKKLSRENPELDELFTIYREDYREFKFTGTKSEEKEGTAESLRDSSSSTVANPLPLSPLSEVAGSKSSSVVFTSPENNTSVTDDSQDEITAIPAMGGSPNLVDNTGIVLDDPATITITTVPTLDKQSWSDPSVDLISPAFTSSSSTSSDSSFLDFDFDFTGDRSSLNATPLSSTDNDNKDIIDTGFSFDFIQDDNNGDGSSNNNNTSVNEDILSLHPHVTYGSLELDNWRNPAVIAL